ncbi:MAG: DUF123 domain-containing protein [Candidatus Njordarchaeota archaeon]
MGLPTTKGTYILIIFLDKNKSIVIGKLGKIYFSQGLYAYVGSAYGSGGIRARVWRHIRKYNKHKFWHIDYLLEHADIERVIIIENKKIECYLAQAMLKYGFEYVPNFGSSDCKCESHLFIVEDIDSLKNILKSKKIKYSEIIISNRFYGHRIIRTDPLQVC